MSNGGHDTRTLDRQTCLSLLASVGVGRVGLSVNALPVIVPVGFCLDGDRIVFALRPQERAWAAVDGVVVAFEADDVDPASGSGWSVLVQGPAHRIAVPPEPTRVDVMSLRGAVPLVAGDIDGELLSVPTDLITGWLTGEGVRQGNLVATPAPV